MNGEEAVVWNSLSVNTLNGMVLHRMAPRYHVNMKPFHTYVEWFHTELFQSFHVKCSLSLPNGTGMDSQSKVLDYSKLPSLAGPFFKKVNS